MVITSEYSTGMIRTSLTAQPRRGVVYAAKAMVFTAVTLVISLVTAFVAFFVGQAIYSPKGVAASLFHTVKIPAQANVNCNPSGGCTATFYGTDVITPSTVLTAIIGTALFVTIVALIAYGVGAIVRHTAGAIAIVIALLFIVPVLEHTLPDTWRWDLMRFLPDAANQVISVTVGSGNEHLWSAWPQLGVTALWAVVLVGVGALPLPQARRVVRGDDDYHDNAERPPVWAPACCRAGGPQGRAGLGVHQDPLGPLHLLDPDGAAGRLHRHRRGDHRGPGGPIQQPTVERGRVRRRPASLGAFFEIGQLIIAILGAMVITSEYSTGMIRTSLTAQPRRGVVYAAKAMVFAGVTLVISLVTASVAYLLGQGADRTMASAPRCSTR